MILQCPNCAARFIVPPQAIGPGGRRVRCARCIYIWHVDLEEDSHEVVPEFVDISNKAIEQPEGQGRAELDQSAEQSDDDQVEVSEVEALAQKLAEKISVLADRDQEDSTQDGPDHPDDVQGQAPEEETEPGGSAGIPLDEAGSGEVSQGTTLPAIIEPRPRYLFVGWVAWGVFVTGFLFSMFIFRETLVEVWPPSARLYEAVGLMDPVTGRAIGGASKHDGTLRIRNHAEPRANADGSFNLIISGTIENTTAEALQLPEFIGVLRNANKQIIHQWRVDLSQSTLGPQGRLKFTTEVPSVPADTSEYEILPDWLD